MEAILCTIDKQKSFITHYCCSAWYIYNYIYNHLHNPGERAQNIAVTSSASLALLPSGENWCRIMSCIAVPVSTLPVDKTSCGWWHLMHQDPLPTYPMHPCSDKWQHSIGIHWKWMPCLPRNTQHQFACVLKYLVPYVLIDQQIVLRFCI